MPSNARAMCFSVAIAALCAASAIALSAHNTVPSRRQQQDGGARRTNGLIRRHDSSEEQDQQDIAVEVEQHGQAIKAKVAPAKAGPTAKETPEATVDTSVRATSADHTIRSQPSADAKFHEVAPAKAEPSAKAAPAVNTSIGAPTAAAANATRSRRSGDGDGDGDSDGDGDGDGGGDGGGDGDGDADADGGGDGGDADGDGGDGDADGDGDAPIPAGEGEGDGPVPVPAPAEVIAPINATAFIPPSPSPWYPAPTPPPAPMSMDDFLGDSQHWSPTPCPAPTGTPDEAVCKDTTDMKVVDYRDDHWTYALVLPKHNGEKTQCGNATLDIGTFPNCGLSACAGAVAANQSCGNLFSMDKETFNCRCVASWEICNHTEHNDTCLYELSPGQGDVPHQNAGDATGTRRRKAAHL